MLLLKPQNLLLFDIQPGFTSFLPQMSPQADAHPQAPGPGSAAKLDQVQSQVNEVKVILKDNISKVLERGERLDDLIGKTDDLQASVSTRSYRFKLSNISFLLLTTLV